LASGALPLSESFRSYRSAASIKLISLINQSPN
jgi:hypothetical protein